MACQRVITPECIEKLRKRQQVVNWIDEEKRTTPVIDVHGSPRSSEREWPDLIASNADKKNLDSLYQYMRPVYIENK